MSEEGRLIFFGRVFGVGLVWSSILEVRGLWINISERYGRSFCWEKMWMLFRVFVDKGWKEVFSGGGERKERIFIFINRVIYKIFCNSFLREVSLFMVCSCGNKVFRG